jgi:hypothetical protein
MTIDSKILSFFLIFYIALNVAFCQTNTKANEPTTTDELTATNELTTNAKNTRITGITLETGITHVDNTGITITTKKTTTKTYTNAAISFYNFQLLTMKSSFSVLVFYFLNSIFDLL